MKTIGRLGALVLSTLLVGAFLANPAAAQTGESFAGRAKAHALRITIAGTDVTIGGTEAEVDSSPRASANGAGVALLGGTTSTAEVSGPGQSDAPPEACLLNIPLLDLLNVEAACSESEAATPDGNPNALSTANIAAIDANGLSLLQPIIAQLTPVVDQTIGTVDGLLNGLLGGLLDPLLSNLNLNVDSLVGDLVEGLERATALLTIDVGDSRSSVTTDSGAVTAEGHSQAARIDVLPGLTLGGDPLLSIIVGEAQATSIYNRGTGVSDASFDPALVRVRLGLPLLGGTVTEIPVTLGAPLELLQGTPLAISVSLGAGKKVENEDGTVGAVADGVAVHLLNNLIGIELAHAESAVGGVPAGPPGTQVFSPRPSPVPVQELAKTGGEPTWLPIGGFVLLLAAFCTRRLLVASHRR